jgi:hypothetical protein
MPAFITSTTRHLCLHKQRGAVLMIMLILLVIATTTLIVSALSHAGLQNEREQITSQALIQAKEGLIGYAVSHFSRPGELPCPDVNDDGELTSSVDFSGSNCTSIIGRLPWKTLGLPELRDGAGEHLWYAVSKPFWYTQNTTLNSDTDGTLTVRDSSGNIINNGCITGTTINSTCPTPNASDAPFGTGAVAVIIAPGEILTRQGNSTAQDRSSAGVNIASNYLDIFTIGGNTEDNASIINGSSTKGFIQGRIKDINKTLYVNDQLLVVTQENIMQAVQKRVANEVKICLNEYAADPQNKGRYPWATTFSSYADTSNQLFGRVPDTLFTNTCLGSGGYTSGHMGDNCSNVPSTGMNNTWTGSCTIISNSGWWLNWKDMVFYGLAYGYKPTTPLNTPAPCTAASCLSVNPPSAIADKKYVVIVAGKALPSQLPRISSNPATYLEGVNQSADQSGTYTFTQGSSSSTFNDTVVFQQ